MGLSQGNGQLNGTKTVATDGNGRAQFNDLSISNGSGTHKLIFAADGFRSATSSKIEVEKVETTTTITGDDPGPSNPGDPVTVSVTVSSPGGTPTGEVEIRRMARLRARSAAPQGSCQVSPTASGDITATYKGNDIFASSLGDHAASRSTCRLRRTTRRRQPLPTQIASEGRLVNSPTPARTPRATATIVEWSWNFGDGTPVSTEQNPSHTFNASIFPYLVTLTVKDDQGATNTTTQSVTGAVITISPCDPPHISRAYRAIT